MTDTTIDIGGKEPYAYAMSKAVEKLTGENPLEMHREPSRAKPIYAPAGVQRVDFDMIVEAVLLKHSVTGTEIDELTPRDIKPYVPKLRMALIEQVMTSQPFYQTMILRGLRKSSEGLSSEQMLCLSIVTDTSSNLSFERRLRKAGVTSYQWSMWLNNKIFRAHFDRLANDLFVKHQSAVDVQVASGALEGRLDFIKYYNEISGKHDPAKKSHADIQMLLNDVVEIVTRNVKDTETLMRISAELSAVVAKLG